MKHQTGDGIETELIELDIHVCISGWLLLIAVAVVVVVVVCIFFFVGLSLTHFFKAPFLIYVYVHGTQAEDTAVFECVCVLVCVCPRQ